MRLLVPTILVTILLAAVPLDTGATPAEIDFVLTFHDDGTWTYDGPMGMLTPHDEETGKRYEWALVVPKSAAVGEVRYMLDTFDLERAKQLRPQLEDSNSGFPLFHYLPRSDVWNTNGPVQVYHVHFEGDVAVLRVQIPQTTDARLVLERDLRVPRYTLGDVEQVTHYSFYQETRTEELTIGELQVRKAGSDGEWVRHPTPQFAFLQKFPVQGLDPGTTYDVRAVFTDWSNNTVTSDPYQVETRPIETGAPPSFEVLEPGPGAILESGSDVTVRVRVLDGDTAVDPTSLRLFVDLEERTELFTYHEGVLTYEFPAPPADGPHIVSVEAETIDGASEHVKWQFRVGDPAAVEASGPAMVLVLALLVISVVRARRPPPS